MPVRPSCAACGTVAFAGQERRSAGNGQGMQGVGDPADQFAAADEQVGNPGLGAIIDKGRAVEPRRVKPRGQRHRDGRRIVPFVLAARMQVDIGKAAHHMRSVFQERPGVLFLSDVEVLRSDYVAGA